MSITSDAQDKSSIRGKVLDENQIILSLVLVKLYRAGDSSLVNESRTNEMGEFGFLKVPNGNYFIAVDLIGYQKKIKGPLVLDADHQTINVNNIVILPIAKQLNTVNITAKKPLIERKSGKIIINVATSTIAAGNSAMEILSKAPGVKVDNEGNISLRGKTGITIMIDDKLTYLSSTQLANLLRSTSANTIQTIEIISNPSAKYDAAGTAGIINIKLKKNTSYGMNGIFTVGGGYGKYYKSYAGITLNHRGKSFNVFGNFNYSNNKEYEDLVIKRSTEASHERSYFDQQATQAYLKKNNNYKVGFDYYTKNNNIIGFMINGYINNNKVNDKINTLIGGQPSKIDSTVTGVNSGESQYKNRTYNLNYKVVVDTLGQEFNADLDYSQVHNTEQTSYSSDFFDASAASYKRTFIFRNSTPSKIKILAGKGDYTYPFNAKIKLETGIKSSYVNIDNDFQSENLQNNSWTNDVTKSNRFTYKEYVNAVYVNLHRDFNSTAFRVGLRTELTRSQGNSITLNNMSKRNYVDFFPSLSINHNLSKAHEIGFSYSKRIDRPDYQSLNPFIYYADLYTLSQGNPSLKPQYANSFELSYGYKKTTNLTFGYINTRDVITTTLLTDTIKKTLLFYEQNLASRSTWSMNISKPITLTDWWSTNNDATIYYSRFTSPDLMGSPFKNAKTTYMFNTSQTFTLSPTLNAELSANYTSSQVYGTYIANSIYGMDLGISRSFADKRTNVKLAINDLFNQREITIKSAIPFQDYHLSQKQESRILRLTFTYNFGSNVIKAFRERSSGSTVEQNRVKSQ